MNSESRIGTVLRNRRIELGISLEQAARDTNIRARMLETLEQGDYAKYPPRGHAIGMLTSYARYLEMNPAPILEGFDSEYQSFTVSREIATSAENTRKGVGRFGEKATSKEKPISRETARGKSRFLKKSDSETPTGTTVNQSLKSEAAAKDDERYKSGGVRVVGTRQTGSFRNVRETNRVTGEISSRYDSRPSSRSGRIGATGSAGAEGTSGSISRSTSSTGAAKRVSTTGSSGRLSSTGSLRHSSSADQSSRSTTGSLAKRDTAPNFFGVDVAPNEKAIKSRPRSRNATRTSESGSATKTARPDENIIDRMRRVVGSVFSERRTRLIALAFALIVIGVIIAASFLIGTAGNKDSGIIQVEGGTVNDTTTTDGENAAHKTITTANGNPVTIKVQVAAGKTSLIQITYDDANAYSGTAVGPFSREFPVTESFSASFGTPDAVTVTENGNPIEIAKNDDGTTGSLYINIKAASS